MLMVVVIGIVIILVAAILILALTKPDSFSVQRTVTIRASPDKILPLIEDFHSWTLWSPWENVDPNMKKTYNGAAAGTGAVYEWEGNMAVGKGRMEITEVLPSSAVTIKLDFEKPMEGHNIAKFSLAASGDTTNVTWAMSGPANFMSKMMQVFMSMDKMVGPQFGRGLANLKTVAEK
jgi:polyketide cyclase/dehydrase/lipid transport protein